MEDIIDIIVTETTNTIEITSQASDEIIDVNIIDNREDVTLNVTPSLVEININSLTGNFGVTWGEITGTLADQTDLNTALSLKADLVGGKVPSSQLPSYVDDIVEVANYAALPATGETGKIYVVLDTNKIYRWSGSAYIEIIDSTAVWGAITGTLSSQTDLQSALDAKQNQLNGTGFVKASGTTITYDNSTYLTTSSAASTYVPYTGATGNVDLGTHTLSSHDLVVNHASGSGVAASITKGGNGEALTVVKSSGSGNAASITGGTTLLSELNVTGGITGTTVALTTSTLVDGLLVNNGSGRGIRVINAGAGYGIIINNETASSAIPFLIQKNGTNKISFTDAGGATYSDRINVPTIYATGSSSEASVTIAQNASYHALSITQSGIGNAIYATGAVTIVGTTNISGQLTLGSTITNSSGYTYTLPSATGTLALTSQLSAYLPLSGGTLTGALSGTSATFSSNVSIGGAASSWAFFKAFQIGNASFVGYGNQAEIWNNSYFDGASKYYGNGFATRFGSDLGEFFWYTAGNNTSGAGASISFTKAMTLGANSGLSIGTTSAAPTNGLLVAGASTFSGSVSISDSATIRGFAGTTGAGMFMAYGSAGAGIGSIFSYNYGTSTYGPTILDGSYVAFYNSGSERMRITGGNVGIGTTAPPSLFSVATSTGNLTASTTTISITSGGQFGSTGTPKNLDLSFLGNSNNELARIRSWDESYSTGYGYLTFWTNNGSTLAERMRITSSGHVLIGQTTANGNTIGMFFRPGIQSGITSLNTTTLELQRLGSTGNVVEFYNQTVGPVGTISVTTTATAYNTSSDYRLKQDLKEFNGLDVVSKIKVYDYEWKADNTRSYGVLAHELQEVLSYAVMGEKDAKTMQGVDYSKLTPILVQAIKELKAELDALKNK